MVDVFLFELGVGLLLAAVVQAGIAADVVKSFAFYDCLFFKIAELAGERLLLRKEGGGIHRIRGNRG